MKGNLNGVLPTAVGSLRWLVMGDRDLYWPPVGPPEWLNPDEAGIWQALRSDKRRHDWLLGRRTAKQLVMDLIFEGSGRQLSLEDIVILPHEDGWPIVTIPTLGDDAPVISLSISHSRDRALCAAVEDKDRPLGVDIEFIEPRSVAFVEEYYTQLEQRFLSAAPVEQLDVLTNAIWSGKEAALKAIRRGLAEDTRIVSCLPHPQMDTPTEWLPMRIEGNKERIERRMPDLSGRWRRIDSFVLTLVYAS